MPKSKYFIRSVTSEILFIICKKINRKITEIVYLIMSFENVLIATPQQKIFTEKIVDPDKPNKCCTLSIIND